MSQHIAYLSVGSNLGDKLANCLNGIDALVADEATVLVGKSPFYRTAPVDYQDQDWFINAVVQITTRHHPTTLLAMLKTIQARLGRREHRIRFGPRVLDLDILLFNQEVIQLPELIIPHPRMHKRRFVLQPICDIDPQIVHPVSGRSMQELLAALPSDEQKVVPI